MTTPKLSECLPRIIEGIEDQGAKLVLFRGVDGTIKLVLVHNDETELLASESSLLALVQRFMF